MSESVKSDAQLRALLLSLATDRWTDVDYGAGNKLVVRRVAGEAGPGEEAATFRIAGLVGLFTLGQTVAEVKKYWAPHDGSADGRVLSDLSEPADGLPGAAGAP